MTLYHQTLPYEIRKTAVELFAGKTGFTQDEMKAFFTEEIRKAVPSPPYPPEGSGFWASFNHMMEYMHMIKSFAQPLRKHGRRHLSIGCRYSLFRDKMCAILQLMPFS